MRHQATPNTTLRQSAHKTFGPLPYFRFPRLTMLPQSLALLPVPFPNTVISCYQRRSYHYPPRRELFYPHSSRVISRNYMGIRCYQLLSCPYIITPIPPCCLLLARVIRSYHISYYYPHYSCVIVNIIIVITFYHTLLSLPLQLPR